MPLTELQNRQRQLEETQAKLEAAQQELAAAQAQFVKDRKDFTAWAQDFTTWASDVRHKLSRFLAGLLVVAALVTVALGIGGYLLTRQSAQRHDAVTSSCEARNQTSKGILRFLHERAPNAPLADRRGNAYFPVIADCDRYADNLTD